MSLLICINSDKDRLRSPHVATLGFVARVPLANVEWGTMWDGGPYTATGAAFMTGLWRDASTGSTGGDSVLWITDGRDVGAQSLGNVVGRPQPSLDTVVTPSRLLTTLARSPCVVLTYATDGCSTRLMMEGTENTSEIPASKFSDFWSAFPFEDGAMSAPWMTSFEDSAMSAPWMTCFWVAVLVSVATDTCDSDTGKSHEEGLLTKLSLVVETGTRSDVPASSDTSCGFTAACSRNCSSRFTVFRTLRAYKDGNRGVIHVGSGSHRHNKQTFSVVTSRFTCLYQLWFAKNRPLSKASVVVTLTYRYPMSSQECLASGYMVITTPYRSNLS